MSRPATIATVRRLLARLPGTEEGTSYGTPGWRVRGKFLARTWEDGEVLVIKCGHDERDFRIQADPDAFFTTDHYRGYPTVLVRLAIVSAADLAEVLETAWRRLASKAMIAEFERR